MEEPLIFEQDSPGLSAVDYENADLTHHKLGSLKRENPVPFPGLSEPQVIRHYTRLSQKNYGIDLGPYPLGSCTMKYNPRLNEKVARLQGFSQLHPLQPESTTQGALDLIATCAHWLCTLTNMPAVAMSPAAGAQGELCGLMTIRSALEAANQFRKRILIPESAHGTNPSTAAMCGYEIDSIATNAQGYIDLNAFKEKLGHDVGAVMITNPNTCGIFEKDILTIAEMIHDVGGYFYCDGANFNALVGRVCPGDLGIDCMHINLHKTFSTPHGGGGPGAGPVVFSEALAPFIPLPYVIKTQTGFSLIEHESDGQATTPFGRLKGFHGQMGMFIRALAYMMSLGADGLKQASEDAILNANYILASLKDVMSPAFDEYCMHEALFNDSFLQGTNISTLDFVKALIDEGFHPMTIYFPLIVDGAMLIEPTETESKATLDQFIGTIKHLVRLSKDPDCLSLFKDAPVFTPRQRLDETYAARHLSLRWQNLKEKNTP